MQMAGNAMAAFSAAMAAFLGTIDGSPGAAPTT